MNSRDKGKRGEREWAKVCSDHGYPAWRGQQFKGTPDSPDVVCPLLENFHFEVKRVERLNIRDAVDVADQDAGIKMPVVAHRRNHSRWLVTMLAEDWFDLVREYVE